MGNVGYHIFSTAIGECGIAWSGLKVVGTQLPERSIEATRSRLRTRFREGAEMMPPLTMQSAVDAITALLAGNGGDLLAIDLDDADVPPFHRSVYRATREIPPGKITTYGEIAKQIGEPSAARAVGQALGRNPFPIIVPCHRVLAAGGKLGGFSAAGGIDTKQRMLAIEGAMLPSANLSLF